MEKNDSSYLATMPASKDNAETILSGEYDSINYVSDKNEGNKHTFKYTATKKTNNLTIDYGLIISFTFTPENGWLAGTVKKEEKKFSGVCGESITWAICKTGELEIKGNGAMADYSKENPAPWSNLPEPFAIKAVIFEDGITHLGAYAFAQCTKLSNIEIPASVKSAGEKTFANCNELKEISYGGSLARWNAYLPEIIEEDMQTTVHSLISNAEIICSGICGKGLFATLDSEGLVTIAGNGRMYNYVIGTDIDNSSLFDSDATPNPPWFKFNSSVKQVVIEPGVESVGMEAFGNCANLVNVSIPDSVMLIDNRAFINCTNLNTLAIPNTVTYIGHSVFSDCTNLKAIHLPEGISALEFDLFFNCRNLAEVSIPSSVTRIEARAFSGCNNLSQITIGAGSSGWRYNTFQDCTNIKNIYYSGTEQQWDEEDTLFLKFTSPDYTYHYGDGSTYHYVYTEPMPQEQAILSAYEYWGVDPEQAEKFGSDIDLDIQAGSEPIEFKKHSYYFFKRYGVGTSTTVWASKNLDVWYVYVDVQTGVCYDDYSQLQ